MHRINKGQAIPGVDVSAQVVNCFRAKYPNISLDKFAHFWVTEPAEELAKRYLEKVGKTEDLTNCLRHRFFLESLQEFSVSAKKTEYLLI